jgi:hypothetical protein
VLTPAPLAGHSVTRMTTSRPAQRWAPTAVTLLTIAWLLAVPALAWRCFGIGLQGWADEQDNGGAHAAELRRQAATAALLLAGVAAGGPALLAVVAFAGRMVKTGAVYIVLTVLLSAPALVAAAEADRTLNPSPPPRPAPTFCQEHSGDDTRCPGG